MKNKFNFDNLFTLDLANNHLGSVEHGTNVINELGSVVNNLGVKASVIYYGRFNPDDDLSIMRSNIIGHFAENDRGISIDNVKEFQAKLKTHNGDHEIYIYPNTMHGFASRPGENSIYNKKASDKAWKRTIRFLNKTLN